MSDSDTVMETYQNYEKALASAHAANKNAVFDALAAAGITNATVTFNGEGDSGQIEEVAAESGGKATALPDVLVTVQRVSRNCVNLEPSQTSLRDAIEELCFDFLSQEHGGWENNAGGCGEFTFHVEDRRIELDFTEYFMDSYQHSHAF